GYAANANKTPYGGKDYRSYFSDPGNIVSLQTMQPVSSTPNLENQLTRYQIFPQKTSHSVYGTASQEVDAGTELFAEGRLTQRSTYIERFPDFTTLLVPSTNPFNPFGAPTAVAYSFLNSLGPITLSAETRNYLGTVGARFKFGGGWRATLSESYGRETLFSNNYNQADQTALAAALADTNPSTAFNAFGGATNPGTIASLQHDHNLHAVSAIETTSLTADGPLWGLPAGDAKLAIGVERREESLDHTVAISLAPVTYGNARYSRHVGSLFSELLVPVVGDAANLHASPRLELNLAARYDDYSDFGHSINPEFRVRWIPLEWLKWRASWGRSYRAPKLDDLYDTGNNASGELALPDPKSATKSSTVLAIQGNNPGLKQETATTWTAGVDIVPVADPGLKFSLTYYAVDYKGQIGAPATSNIYDILLQENEWAGVITRNPTRAQIAAVCNRPDYFQSRSECLASSPAAIVDYRLNNLASTKVTGFDVDLRQTLDSDVGRFNLGFNGSYVFHFDQAVTDTSPSVDIVNTFDNPLRLRFRATAGWSQSRKGDNGLGVDLALNYTNGYDNPGST